MPSRLRKFTTLFLLLLLVGSGCGRFAAHRMVQAPNSYPTWLAPKAPVTLDFSGKLLSAFTNQYVQIPNPAARIRYRVVEPGDYQFQWTNHLDQAHNQFDFSFDAKVDHLQSRTNRWTTQPRGTVVLLHGYGVSGFAMLPWAFLLAQDGWRCVLVDLRGHGKSTGKQIYFGTQEVQDLQMLLDELQRDHHVDVPVNVIGHSYGAVLALRWRMVDHRVDRVVAISPYADLSKAVLNIAHQYAHWLPDRFLKAGLRKLPDLLQVPADDLNPDHWVRRNQQLTLFVAGGADKIAPADQVELLFQLAGPGNEMLVVPQAAHEPLPFYLDDLAQPVKRWLSGNPAAQAATVASQGESSGPLSRSN